MRAICASAKVGYLYRQLFIAFESRLQITSHRSTPMRTALRIQARIRNPQPLHRSSANQVLGHNLVRILRLHVSVPYRFGIHHNRRPMFALVQTARFVDAHTPAQPGVLRQLIQPRVQIAFSIGSAGRPRRIRRTGIQANKNVALERWQAVFSSGGNWFAKCASVCNPDPMPILPD